MGSHQGERHFLTRWRVDRSWCDFGPTGERISAYQVLNRYASSIATLGWASRPKSTEVESHYFYQAIWAGRLIADHRAIHHVDIGSDHRMVGMLTWLKK